RINKEVLKRILIMNPEKRINRQKIKSLINLISPIALVIFIFIPNFHYRDTVIYITGLLMFVTVFFLIYYWQVTYFFLLRKVDFSATIVVIKKQIATLEKYKIKSTKLKYALMPIAILGIFGMLIQKPNFNKESIVLIVLIVAVFTASALVTFKISIKEQFRQLNKEINEVEKIEEE
ncbi:MAG TPA: hypothetical protein PKV50_05260, partial [Prolixibacteraceae bacterium]|nr:hypothetical protein [Prolixibacteraceae bacterium]